MRQFVSERFGVSLSRSSCLNWLHRLGFAFKRPKKRSVKIDETKRETSVADYAALWEEARGTGARIFSADEAQLPGLVEKVEKDEGIVPGVVGESEGDGRFHRCLGGCRVAIRLYRVGWYPRIPRICRRNRVYWSGFQWFRWSGALAQPAHCL